MATTSPEQYDVYNRPMRLKVIDKGRGLNLLQRLQILPIRLAAGNYPSPHLVLSYRRDLHGRWFVRFLQRALRKSSEWNKGELELFAAFTAKQLACDY